MTFINIVELLFSLSIVFLTYRIVNTINVVESVLLLILLAINFSLFLFFYSVNFLAILYLAVYIGAVAVFFLFVVMMTDLHNSILNDQQSLSYSLFNVKYKNLYYFFISLLSFALSNLFLTLLNFSTGHLSFLNYYSNIDFFNLNIEAIGFSMFNEHSGPFIIMSLIILIGLIGSIFITNIANDSLKINNIVKVPSFFGNSLSDATSKTQDMEIQAVRTLLNSINLGTNNK